MRLEMVMRHNVWLLGIELRSSEEQSVVLTSLQPQYIVFSMLFVFISFLTYVCMAFL